MDAVLLNLRRQRQAMQLQAALDNYSRSRELAADTRRKLQHRINCWRKHGGAQASPASTDFNAFRDAAKKHLSRRTIEETVGDIARLYGVEDVGQRLRRWKTASCRPVPSTELLSSAYDNAASAEWPVSPRSRTPQLNLVSNEEWWRAFLVFAFFTGMRLRDLRSITWQDWDRARWQASKTGKVHHYPECAIVARHLRPLRTRRSPRIFAFSKSQERFVRRELKFISGSELLTPQAIRRCSITQWTIAGDQAGKLIHGIALGVMTSYLDVQRILAASLPRLTWPAAFLLSRERDRRTQAAERIQKLTSRLNADRLQDLERVVTAFVMSGNSAGSFPLHYEVS